MPPDEPPILNYASPRREPPPLPVLNYSGKPPRIRPRPSLAGIIVAVLFFGPMLLGIATVLVVIAWSFWQVVMR